MSDYFIYVDETGTPDFTSVESGGSPYFGFGSLVVKGEHADLLWDMSVLRLSLAQQGVDLSSGFHAKDDS